MSHWNYRVVRKSAGEGTDGFVYFIHEAYYETDDETEEETMVLTENPVYPVGSTIEELKEALNMMLGDIERFKDEVIDEHNPENDSGSFNEDVLA